MITVFTPTYNRKNRLKNLYHSLLNQDYNDFEWLIIDDGSTDGTKDYIEKLKSENKMNINYVYKENGGKMSAVNMAHDIAKGEAFITIDSDDELVPDILGTMHNDFTKISKNDSLAGIIYLAAYKNEPEIFIGDKFPKDDIICSYMDFKLKYKISGDKAALWKTDVLRNYKYPIIDGEKFIPDIYLMMKISEKKQVITKNKIVMLVEYLDNGYSNNYFNLVKKNPKGNVLYFKELYKYDKSFYNVYGYILFSLFAKVKFKNILKEHRAKFKIILLYLPTYIIYLLRK